MYTAKITDAKTMDILSDNTKVLDVSFDIMLDGKKITDRRLAFPLGTTEEAILLEVKSYCTMFENDHALAEEVSKRSEMEAEAEGVLSSLKGQEV
jgi:hypothetical protein